jgi:hypothetical protein
MALTPDEDNDRMPRCRCNRFLWSQTEREVRLCNSCADSEYDRELKHREFAHYHGEGSRNGD